MPEGRAAPPVPGTHAVVDALDRAGVAALEDATGGRVRLPMGPLPAWVREGDVVRVIVGDDTVTLVLDRGATQARRRALEARHERLPRAPAGDLAP
jgi:hypothetical protein